MFENYEREILRLRSKYGEVNDIRRLRDEVMNMRNATTSRAIKAAQTRFEDITQWMEE